MGSKTKSLAAGFALPKPRKREQVHEATARAFETAQDKPPVGLRLVKKPSAASMMRDAAGDRIVAYVDPELATELRLGCARERRSISDAFNAALRAWTDTSDR